MYLDHTHEASAQSWVVSANAPSNDFPIQNLPHGVFETASLSARGGMRIGDSILDLQAAVELKLFDTELEDIALAAALNDLTQFMAMGNDASKKLRHAVFAMLLEGSDESEKALQHKDVILVPVSDATMLMPAKIPSFIDFMTSIYHTTTKRKSRPERPLHEPMMHLPVGYNSRASTKKWILKWNLVLLSVKRFLCIRQFISIKPKTIFLAI